MPHIFGTRYCAAGLCLVRVPAGQAYCQWHTVHPYNDFPGDRYRIGHIEGLDQLVEPNAPPIEEEEDLPDCTE